MSVPRFASVGFTVPVGKQDSGTVISTMAQELGNTGTVPPGLGPLAAMGWAGSIASSTALSADGLTVRRMFTFNVPAAPAGGQQPYRSADAVKKCLRNLYTRQLEGFCGTKVTGLEPVVFDDPLTIFGVDLDSWWTSRNFGGSLAQFDPATPELWASTGPGGIGPGREFGQGIAPDQLALGAVDAQLNGGQPVVSTGAPKGMYTPAIAALAQPWSVAVIGVADAASSGNWTDGVVTGDAALIRTGASETFTTDNGVHTLVGPPQDGNPHLRIGIAKGASSSLIVDGARYIGNAGAGTPTGFTLLANAIGANNLAADVFDKVVVSREITNDEWLALYAYAQGRYGIGYW